MYKDHPDYERTLVLLKPDAVQRGLMGEIISRFERKGLKITAVKMAWADTETAKKHYDQPEDAMMLLGRRTLENYAEKGVEHKFSDPMDIARDIQSKLVNFLTTGPVLAMVVEGVHAVAHVRKIRGGTNPLSADVGTITGDFTVDSYFLADTDDRAIRNLAHASGSREEAEYEIPIWFTPEEVFSFQHVMDQVIYSKKWESEDRESMKSKKLE